MDSSTGVGSRADSGIGAGSGADSKTRVDSEGVEEQCVAQMPWCFQM